METDCKAVSIFIFFSRVNGVKNGYKYFISAKFDLFARGICDIFYKKAIKTLSFSMKIL